MIELIEQQMYAPISAPHGADATADDAGIVHGHVLAATSALISDDTGRLLESIAMVGSGRTLISVPMKPYDGCAS